MEVQFRESNPNLPLAPEARENDAITKRFLQRVPGVVKTFDTDDEDDGE